MRRVCGKKKKKLNEKRLKRLNAKLECHMVGPHALSHEVSAFIYIYILMILTWLPNGGLLNTLNTKFGFWCFHHSSLSFSYSSLKNGGFHGAIACLDVVSDFVFITQF